MNTNNGLLWRGPSELNGEPIVVAVTGLTKPSRNGKIGAMAQVWIVPVEEPRTAIPSGRDVSVCGDCPARPSSGGGCYVHWRWGPQQVWHTAEVTKTYRQLEPRDFAGLQVRFGAYGDPAAVPLEVWAPVLDQAAGWTGYTHQWRKLDDRWRWLMASCDSIEDQAAARARGWRTFRVRPYGAPKLPGEVVCPAADEAPDRGVTCASCGLCNGAGVLGERSRVRDVVIVAHGMRAPRHDAVHRMLARRLGASS